MNNQRRHEIKKVMRSLEVNTKRTEAISADYRRTMKALQDTPDSDSQIKNIEQRLKELGSIAFDMEDARLALEDAII